MVVDLKQTYNEFISELNKHEKTSKETYDQFVKQYGQEVINEIIANLPVEQLDKVSFLAENEAEIDPNNELRLIEQKYSNYDGYSDDSIKMYLQEIISVPLLTPDEERKLFEKIAEYNNQIEKINEAINNSHNSIEAKELKDRLLKINKKVKEIKDNICNHNLRLVVSIANKYSNSGLPLLDLIQEGNIGLMEAINRFDIKKGFKLSTYATWWIRQAISRFVANNARTIRIPVHMKETIIKIKKIRDELEISGQTLSDEELAIRLGVSLDTIRMAEIYKHHNLVSLDAPINSEEDSTSTLGDFIKDEDTIPVEEEGIMTSMKEDLKEVLETLSPRELEVISMRFGLQDDNILTLAEVGNRLGLTRERIRQIESKALRKLRNKRQELSIYLEK